MGDSSKKRKYQLRDKLHQIRGEYSEEDLLQRIAAGRYTGEEEVSELPMGEWSKMAAHPTFYDAFLRRLYEAAPEPEIKDSEINPFQANSEVPASQEGTARPPTQIQDPADERGGHTQHLPVEGKNEFGATIHQSEIDALFESSKNGAKGLSSTLRMNESDPEKSQQNEIPELAAPLFQEDSNKPIDPPPSSEVPPTPATVTSPPSKKNRMILVAGVAAGAIFILRFLLPSTQLPEGQKVQTELSAGEKLRISEQYAFNIREGNEAYASDTIPGYQRAAEYYSKALNQRGDSAGYFGRLALSYAHLLQENKEDKSLTEKAEKAISQGRALEPQMGAFYLAEAMIAGVTGNLDASRKALDSALEVDATDPESNFYYAEQLLAVGNVTDTKIFLDRGNENDHGLAYGHYLSGKLALKNGELEAAKGFAARAISITPVHCPSYILIADVLSKQNLIRESRIYFEMGARLYQFCPKELAAYAASRTGKLYSIEGKEEEARKYYILAISFDKKQSAEIGEQKPSLDLSEDNVKKIQTDLAYDRQHFQQRAEEFTEQKRFEEALRFYKGLRFLEPGNYGLLVASGELEEKLARNHEDYQHAIELFRWASDIQPDAAKPYIRLGSLYTLQYQFELAEESLIRAEQLAPEDWEVYATLGKHFFKRQNYDLAGDYFRKAQFLNSNESEIYLYQGHLYRMYSTDSLKEATRLYYQAYSLDTENYEALAEWLKSKVISREKIFAVKFLRNLAETNPKNPNIEWVFGEVYAANSEYIKAISYYHRALDIDSRSARFRMSLAKAEIAIGKLGDAVAEYQKAFELDPKTGEALYEAASILIEGKEYPRAEETLKSLLGAYPTFPGARRLLALVYRAKNEKDKALAYMKEEADSSPGNYKYAIELAEMNMLYGDFQAASDILKKVSSISLGNAKNIASTGSGQADKDGNNLKAIKLKALLLLSKCYRAMNRGDTAEGAATAAAALDEKEPEVYRELGYVYSSQQRDREAKKAFETYLSRNPVAKDAEEIRNIISKTVIEE